MRCDLHIHSTCSDGTLEPTEIIEQARRACLQVISITDHDCVDAYDALPTTSRLADNAAHAKSSQPFVIPGVELSVCGDSEEIHLLGYFPRGFSPRFRLLLARLQRERQERMRQLVAKLARKGLPIRFDDVLARCTGAVISRAHVAQALLARGIVSRIGDAFRTYLDYRHGYSVPPQLQPRQAIDTVRREGGISIWAHPTREQAARWSERLVEMGLNGIEIYTRRRDADEVADFERLAQRWRMLGSGGSDFHGRPYEQLGEHVVPASAIRKLLGFCAIPQT